MQQNYREDDDSGSLPKNPQNYIFPERCPPGCGRDCERIFQSHTRTISFALYATKDPAKQPSRVCAYAFSCGQDIESFQIRLKKGETPADMVRRLVPELIDCFIKLAEAEKECCGIQNN